MSKTLRFSFKRSIPIMVGFFPIGIAYGILMHNAGYNFLWSGLCSLIVFAGSLQFLMVTFFTSSVPMITVIVMALLLNSRHIFYGLSFIDKFRLMGKWRLYLIFSLCDENYSLHCSYKPEEGVSEKKAFVITAALTQLYWIVFSMLGGLVGQFITFDTTGIDFALTALFVVILLDHLRYSNTVIPAITAIVSSIVCILIFGVSSFILPSLIFTVMALMFMRVTLESKIAEQAEKEVV